MLVGLGFEKSAKVSCFLEAYFFFQTHKNIGYAEVAVIFRNFVFQNEVVSECVPGQVGDGPVVLVPVVTIMRKNQIRAHSSFELFKEFLDLAALIRKEAIAKLFDDDLCFCGFAQIHPRAGSCFRLPAVRRR